MAESLSKPDLQSGARDGTWTRDPRRDRAVL